VDREQLLRKQARRRDWRGGAAQGGKGQGGCRSRQGVPTWVRAALRGRAGALRGPRAPRAAVPAARPRAARAKAAPAETPAPAKPRGPLLNPPLNPAEPRQGKARDEIMGLTSGLAGLRDTLARMTADAKRHADLQRRLDDVSRQQARGVRAGAAGRCRRTRACCACVCACACACACEQGGVCVSDQTNSCVRVRVRAVFPGWRAAGL
jgi:hypothetical protein